jgi:hypothetical protein
MEPKRRGDYIWISPGITAREGYEGSLPTLEIRRKGKRVKFYRGSSLYFADPLSLQDKQFLEALAN